MVSFVDSLVKSGIERGRRLGAARVAAAALAGVSIAAGAADDPVATENTLYATHCIACHGADLSGIEGLGVSLVDSQFVAGRSTAELVAFVKAGRMPGDPGNVSGGAMPGFSWVPEADLTAIVEFVKARHAR